ncbi:thioredoxin domain-containing protein [Planctomycetota bacterium]|nr:thioredoxin domain-containing protein [Planctomycetota bacterium]
MTTTPNQTTTYTPTQSTSPLFSKPLLLILTLLSFAALLVSTYLTISSYTASGPIGCGSGSGCGEVLASKYAKLGPISISIIATLTYLVLIPALFLAHKSKPAKYFLNFAAGSILVATIFYTYLQFITLKAVCPYCMTDHILGSIIAIIILIKSLRPQTLIPFILGIAIMISVAFIQNASSATIYRIPTPTEGDYDITDDISRRIGLMNGSIQISSNNAPTIGSTTAPTTIALLFDYACPHCKHTHHLVRDYLAQHPNQLAVILLPMPLNNACNPHASEDQPQRFWKSCERTRIAFAIYLAAPEKYKAFDDWMFETDTWRTLEETQTYAEKLLTPVLLKQTLTDPRINQMIEHNVKAYNLAGGARVPITLAPHTEPIEGRIEDLQAFESFLDEAQKNKTKSEQNVQLTTQ